MFNDVEYNSLDEISKLLEPYRDPRKEIVNDYMPDEIPIKVKHIYKKIADNSTSMHSFEIGLIIQKELNTISIEKNLDVSFIGAHFLSECYSVQSDESDINISKASLEDETGAVLKKKIDMTEEKIKKDIIKLFTYNNNDVFKFRSICIGTSKETNSRINEILSIFDLERVRVKNSERKYRTLIQGIKSIMCTEELNIKNYMLGLKFSKWIAAYVLNGSTGAMSNICKLKILTHSKKAIYSIEEEAII